MAILPILQHPHANLRAKCEHVRDFGPGLRRLAEDMFETMYAAPGRGLAAPQVGAAQRIFVTDTTWKDGAPLPQVFVNPVIIAANDIWQRFDESCLSIIGVTVSLQRPETVQMHWQDLAGAWHEGSFSGIASVCVQHERDHLDGILCIDYPPAPALS